MTEAVSRFILIFHFRSFANWEEKVEQGRRQGQRFNGDAVDRLID
jgi:hypothetical protein